MSAPTLPDTWLQQRLSGRFHRQLVLISGSETWTMARAEQIRQQFSGRSLWVGHQADKAGVDCGAYRHYLGREYDLLVYNAFSGLRANALMALSGTVTQNGLMLLLCPDFKSWPRFTDPQWAKRFSYGFDHSNIQSRFIHWLLEQAESDPKVLHLTEQGIRGEMAPLSIAQAHPDGPCITQDQQRAVEAVIKVATGHRNRPLILTADRGRGKSSALGIAAARLITSEKKNILITAPAIEQTEQCFIHAAKNIESAQRHAYQLTAKAGGSIRFQPVDQIIREKAGADLLMVDEAAAIPAPLLKTLAEGYSRVVFSSTVHGYEGCGRGFELRFKPVLQKLRPQARYLHLNQPVRFQQGDCLENFWFKVMLMDSTKRQSDVSPINTDTLEFLQLQPDKLIKQPELLHQLFELLINAHYQTSPDDLVRLLDAPQSRLFVLKTEDKIIAAILADEEGGDRLSPLYTDITLGKRRVQGHLLAQNLSHWLNDSTLAGLRYLRIVRIAVTPEYWQQGLGSHCLVELRQYAKAQDFDMIGSSFGATGQLMGFWQKNDFVPCRLGLKQDMASGEHSMVVLLALSDNARNSLPALLKEFQREFIALLPVFFRALDPDLVQHIVLQFPAMDPISDGDIQKLSRFSKGIGAPDSVFVQLQQLSLWLCQQTVPADNGTRALIRYSLQHQSQQQICEEFKLNGRKAFASLVRQRVETYLHH
ncbi:tRNA(Met) cytidine acetyltransferase TmcA [Lacimicrobium alkaliphilum]|uniref:tRNA(Met) cytidine acetyltransferase TmcA n=1 Tax=Lacimicrobium alkaliphilum TaxID=1526571 RepID=A0ABQ1R2P7_9ALTE|nr:GNAT family N-acetyltransferase [Lacimicrobium alkaliphilum]GGD56076.1 tRNA(Met) cytidine acetyltransferase TmcA [Lacimicrobium alkaliphilum]